MFVGTGTSPADYVQNVAQYITYLPWVWIGASIHAWSQYSSRKQYSRRRRKWNVSHNLRDVLFKKVDCWVFYYFGCSEDNDEVQMKPFCLNRAWFLYNDFFFQGRWYVRYGSVSSRKLTIRLVKVCHPKFLACIWSFKYSTLVFLWSFHITMVFISDASWAQATHANSVASSLPVPYARAKDTKGLVRGGRKQGRVTVFWALQKGGLWKKMTGEEGGSQEIKPLWC